VRPQWLDIATSESETDDVNTDERMLGDGSDEDDSLLVIYREPSSVY